MHHRFSLPSNFAEGLEGTRYYKPTDQGLEGRFKQRLEDILRWKNGADDKD